MTKRLPVVIALLLSIISYSYLWGQSPSKETREPEGTGQQTADGDPSRRLRELRNMSIGTERSSTPSYASSIEYRIGPEDLLEISVFEAPELNRSARVSMRGEISFPLLGSVRVADLTPRELESVLGELLRRTFLKDPHVGVFVSKVQSHPVSVFGAVKRPGVVQIRQPRSLIEILSMVEGLAEDAGDTVIVMRRNNFAERSQRQDTQGQSQDSRSPEERTTESLLQLGFSSQGGGSVKISLKELLESGDPALNILVYPGDFVKVTRAGIVYVIGEVKRAGGFVLKSNENISVLQALALAEGLRGTAAKNRTLIIRTDEKTGERIEMTLDLGKVLKGSAPDPMLQPNDILFVPNSAVRSALIRAGETAISIVSGVIIWRR